MEIDRAGECISGLFLFLVTVAKNTKAAGVIPPPFRMYYFECVSTMYLRETDMAFKSLSSTLISKVSTAIVIAPFLFVLAKAGYVKGGERHRGKASKPCCILCCIRCEKSVFECNTHATRGVSILTLE